MRRPRKRAARAASRPQHQIRAAPYLRDDAAALVVPPRRAEQMLCVSHRKLYQLLRDGELDSLTIGRARRITVASITALIERQLRAGRTR